MHVTLAVTVVLDPCVTGLGDALADDVNVGGANGVTASGAESGLVLAEFCAGHHLVIGCSSGRTWRSKKTRLWTGWAQAANLIDHGKVSTFFATPGPPDFVLLSMGSSSVFRSLRYAVRSLMGDKGFTVTVVLTIAVCIAANTATFTVVNSVLLRPLPVPDARSILLMANRYPKAGADDGYNSSSGDYYDRLRYVQAFSEQALFLTTGRTIDIQGTPQRVTGMVATPSLFRLLRVSPVYGRAFSDAEGEPGANQKVILSDGMSRQLFGSPEAALGRDVRMSGQPFTVVGVMPAGFNFIDSDVRLWVPAAFTPRQREVHHSNYWQSIGRLKPGATLQQAQSQMDALNRANLDRFPNFKELLVNAGFHTVVVPLEDMLVKQVHRRHKYCDGA